MQHVSRKHCYNYTRTHGVISYPLRPESRFLRKFCVFLPDYTASYRTTSWHSSTMKGKKVSQKCLHLSTTLDGVTPQNTFLYTGHSFRILLPRRHILKGSNLLLCPDDTDRKLLRNVRAFLPDYTAPDSKSFNRKLSKHRFQQHFYCCMWPLPSNGRCLRIYNLAKGLHATM
jgi:hypothetical protein